MPGNHTQGQEATKVRKNATATKEDVGAGSDKTNTIHKVKRRPRSEDEPQAEAKSQDSEGIRCGKTCGVQGQPQ